jgi:hypothetical protein
MMGATSMYETSSLVDSGFLASRGLSYRIRPAPDSAIFFFRFDELSEPDAQRLLGSAEAEACRRFHASVRSLRRRMDCLGGGRRP